VSEVATTDVPILLLAFNRPKLLYQLIESLRETRPSIVRVSVDGPRPGNQTDAQNVAECVALIKTIDWTDNVDSLIQPVNVGLERCVPSAVSWVLTEFDRIIVLEDDTRSTTAFVNWATSALEKFESDERVMHISGYNVVPSEHLDCPDSLARLSRLPESFAWATWRRAWNLYDANLEVPRSEISSILRTLHLNTLERARWRLNFALARRHLISSWAYRWIFSIWRNDGFCLNPNLNFVSYHGHDSGTHTRRTARWKEQPVRSFQPENLQNLTDVQFDKQAETFTQVSVFNCTRTSFLTAPLELSLLYLRNFFASLKYRNKK